jgi:hypothetical protein
VAHKVEQVFAVGLSSAAFMAGCGGHNRPANNCASPQPQIETIRGNIEDGGPFNTSALTTANVSDGYVEVGTKKDPAIYNPLVLKCGGAVLGYVGRLGGTKLEFIPASKAEFALYDGRKGAAKREPLEATITVHTVEPTPDTGDHPSGFTDGQNSFGIIP